MKLSRGWFPPWRFGGIMRVSTDKPARASKGERTLGESSGAGIRDEAGLDLVVDLVKAPLPS